MVASVNDNRALPIASFDSSGSSVGSAKDEWPANGNGPGPASPPGAALPKDGAGGASDSKPIRVMQVLPSLDGGGGVERGSRDIAMALRAHGMGSYIACRSGKEAERLSRQGITHIPIDLHRRGPLSIATNAVALIRAIRQYKIDIVHVRSRAPAWSCLVARWWTNVAVVTTFHGFYSGHDRFFKRFYNQIMLRAQAVIAVSPFIASHIRKYYRCADNRLHMIGRGVDRHLFDPDRVRPEHVRNMRRSWGVSDKDQVVLLAGRVSPWKGHRWLLESFASCASNQESMAAPKKGRQRLVCIGHAEQNRRVDDLKARAGRLGVDIILAGHCSDMATAYMAADVVVAPSLKPEAFGRVAAEALVMGRPVIAAAHGGFLDIVAGLRDYAGTAMIAVEPGNHNQLSAALDRLWHDRPGTICNALRAHVLERYSLELMTQKTLAVYRHVGAEKNRHDRHQRVVVILFGALGDIIRASGAMASIRRHHRDAHITLATTKPYLDLADQLALFDDWWSVRRSWFWLGRNGLWRMLGRLRRHRPHIVYDLQNSRKSRFLRHAFTASRWPTHWCGRARRPDDKSDALERIGRQLRGCGVTTILDPDIRMIKSDLRRFGVSSPYVLLAPGASKDKKRWTEEGYGILLDFFSKRGFQSVIVASAAERSITRRIWRMAPRDVLDLGGRTGFADLAMLADGATLAVGHDSGPSHIFATRGCPCLLLLNYHDEWYRTVPRGDVRFAFETNLKSLSISKVTNILDMMLRQPYIRARSVKTPKDKDQG